MKDIRFTQALLIFLMKCKEITDEGIAHVRSQQTLRACKRLESIRHLLERYKPKSVLDIGCGLAVIDILLAREMGVNTIHLYDGAGFTTPRSDFAEDMEPWVDVRAVAEFVKENVPDDVGVYHTIAPADIDMSFCDVDLIVSFKSWGVHYPLHTYLPLARRNMKIGGLLLLDIEETRVGRPMLIEGFRFVERIGKRPDRAVWAFERE